jgi:hypothetical protein
MMMIFTQKKLYTFKKKNYKKHPLLPLSVDFLKKKLCLCLYEDYFPETNIEIERYLHFTDTHKGSSRRGSRNSSSASATSVRSNRSLQHHRPSEQYHTTHTVVTNPNQLFSVNQQQHMQHQLMIHQQTQRRRSSISQSVLQHAAQVAASSNINNLQTQKQLIEEDTQTAIQLPKDHVKVEITEVKP